MATSELRLNQIIRFYTITLINMSIAQQINEDIKSAMKAKEREKLESLRAVKAAILLAASEKGASIEVSDETVLKIVQKLVKQRKDSATLYREQNRADLAENEESQAAVIEAYLPQQMSEGDVRTHVKEAVTQTGASGPGDMGKVMGMLTKKLAGLTDGKTISKLVKEELT